MADRARLVDDNGIESSPLLGDATLTGLTSLASAGNAATARGALNALAADGFASFGAGLTPTSLTGITVPAPVTRFRAANGAPYKRGAGLQQVSDASGALLSIDTSYAELQADWLGCALNGSTDDAARINAALALGIVVVIPYGKTAAIGSTLVLPIPGAGLAGLGTIKLLSGFANDAAVSLGAGGCVVRQVLIDASAVVSLSRWVLSGIVANASLSSLDLRDVTVLSIPFNGISIGSNGGAFTHGRVSVSNCTVMNAGWVGMAFSGVATLTVSDHTISATGYTALDLSTGMGDATISRGNVSRSTSPSTVYSGPGNPNVDTSTTSQAIVSSGSVTFTITKNASTFLGFYVGKLITAHVGHGGPTGNQDKTRFMQGTVTAYSGTSLTLNIIASGGSGTFADWTLFAQAGGLLGWLPPMTSLNVSQGKYSDCLQGGYDAFLLGEDGVGTTFGPTSIMGVTIEKSRGGGIDMTSNMKVVGCTIRDCLNPILFTLDLGGTIRDAVVIGNSLIDAGSTTGNNGSAVRFAPAFNGSNLAFVNIKISNNTIRGTTATLYGMSFHSDPTVGYQDVYISGNVANEIVSESFLWTGAANPPNGITFGDNLTKAPTGTLKNIATSSGILTPFGYKDYLLISNSAMTVSRIVQGGSGRERLRFIANDSNTTFAGDWGNAAGYGGDRILTTGNVSLAVALGSIVVAERAASDRGWYVTAQKPY